MDDRECAFEPSGEIRCVECGKPTGERGTCEDIAFCAACRAAYIDAGMAVGETAEESRLEFSEMLIAMIEGVGYKSKFRPQRALHIAHDGAPACKARGGPHPMTTDASRGTCKRCLRALERKQQ